MPRQTSPGNSISIPEAALRHATAKFERRFRHVETLAAEHAVGTDLDALEALWQQVKCEER